MKELCYLNQNNQEKKRIDTCNLLIQCVCNQNFKGFLGDIFIKVINLQANSIF